MSEASGHSKELGNGKSNEKDVAKVDQGDFEKLLPSLRGRYTGVPSLVDALHRERRRDDEASLKKHRG